MSSPKIYQIHPMPATKCLQSLERHLHVPSEFFFVISTGKKKQKKNSKT